MTEHKQGLDKWRLERRKTDRHRAGGELATQRGGPKPLGPFGSRPERLLVLAVSRTGANRVDC
jgi:hypothetical protein